MAYYDRPQRSKHSRWCTLTPITDIYEAIDVLQIDGTTLRETHLKKCEPAIGEGYEILVPWAREGSSGGDTSGTHYFHVDSALAEKMKEEGLLTPFIEKGWGYSRERPDELVLTSKAYQMLEEFEKEMEKKAESMLTPGIHTDLTGKPKRTAWSRDGFKCGKLYFEYKLPQGGVVRVYPQEDRLVMPDEEKTA